MLAYYGNKYGKPFPNSLKKGVSLGLAKFDAYQLAKYKGDTKEVKLVDVLNLVHPKPAHGQAVAFKKLIHGDLKNTETWEAKISKAGQVEAETDEERETKVAKNKAKAWKDMLESDKLGYFALLRNVRNIMDQAPEMIDLMCEKLQDKKLIRNSLILPFQFKKAFDAVLEAGSKVKILKALNNALELSVDNCPEFDGKTLIVLDSSGSMTGHAGKSGDTPANIGALFAAVLLKKNSDADLMLFSDDARYIKINPASLLTDMIDKIKGEMRPAGTNFNAIFEIANKAYDRVIILSDMQGWMSASDGYYNLGGAPIKTFAQYKAKYDADPNVFSFDLQGYGTLQFPQNKVYAIAGFSDKTLALMKLLEEDRNVLVNKIKAVTL
jgi:hypothetical protein